MGLLVADRNRDDGLKRADKRTVGALRSAGEIDQNVPLYHGCMDAEAVRWTADVISGLNRGHLS